MNVVKREIGGEEPELILLPNPPVLPTMPHFQLTLKSQAFLKTKPAMSPATAKNLATEDWPGAYGFNLEVPSGAENGQKSSKSLAYSQLLQKAFVDHDRLFEVRFSVERPFAAMPPGLRVRAVLIYTNTDGFFTPVLRCPNHQSSVEEVEAQRKQVLLAHLDGDDNVRYEEDSVSGRLSFSFPLRQPQSGTHYCSKFFKFACLGSCSGGINRRPTSVIFTLETIDETVVGRRRLPVRICSCPLRDMKQEEMKASNKCPTDVRAKKTRQEPPVENEIASTSSSSPPPAKLARVESITERLPEAEKKRQFYLVPVFGVDNFKAVNKFAQFLHFQSGFGDSGRTELLKRYNSGTESLQLEEDEEEDDIDDDDELKIWDES